MNPSAPNHVHITRLFDAPREFVFRAWSDTAHLSRWFAPNGCTIQFKRLEFRAGGSFHSCIRTPDGYECWCVGDYREITPNERIVYTMAIADERGQRIDPSTKGMDPTWPAETVLTVIFEDVDGQTRLTLHQTVDEALAKRTGAHPSWLQMLDRLDTDLAQTLNALWEKA
ncbi:MAG TPA: SRPBCC domain-containing protein [Verrucomicrobiae bacterium]